MRISIASGVRNDLLQTITDQTLAIQNLNTTIEAQTRNPLNLSTPLPKAFWFGAPLAPHTGTVRATYTVPANKVALVGTVHMTLRRQTVAAPVSYASIDFNYRPLGGGGISVLHTVLHDNVVGAQDKGEFQWGFMMQATDLLTFSTTDLSTGGTVFYQAQAIITEFDA